MRLRSLVLKYKIYYKEILKYLGISLYFFENWKIYGTMVLIIRYDKDKEKTMKKEGIINRQLAGEIAALGHQDLFLICNSSLALPASVPVIDLALKNNIPTLMEVLGAIVNEAKIEYYFIPEELKTENTKLYEDIIRVLPDIKEETAPSIGFKTFTKNVKFIVRTGDTSSYGNIILGAGKIG